MSRDLGRERRDQEADVPASAEERILRALREMEGSFMARFDARVGLYEDRWNTGLDRVEASLGGLEACFDKLEETLTNVEESFMNTQADVHTGMDRTPAPLRDAFGNVYEGFPATVNELSHLTMQNVTQHSRSYSRDATGTRQQLKARVARHLSVDTL